MRIVSKITTISDKDVCGCKSNRILGGFGFYNWCL